MGMEVDIRWRGDKVSRSARKGAAHGLRLGAEHVLTVANTRVPHREGTLEQSGATDVDADQLRASVYYDTPYAAVQHEDMTLSHDEGRQSKYLETALTDTQTEVARIIAQAIRDDLGS